MSSYFRPFNVNLATPTENFPKCADGYSVLMVDLASIETKVKKGKLTPEEEDKHKFDDDDDENYVDPRPNEYVQEVDCQVLIANEKTGVMEWFSLAELKFVKTLK